MSDRSIEILGTEGPRWWVAKPAGVPVFPPHGNPDGDCVLARILDRLPGRREGWPDAFAGGIAHRLDTATSGLLLVARAPDDLPGIRAEFGSGRLRKFYEFRSVGTGVASGGGGLVDAPLAHHPRRADRMVVRTREQTPHRGKWYPAWTHLTPLFEPDHWQAEIRTGVMHQIRAHAAFRNLPLDGDPVYGGGPGAFCLHHRETWGDGWRSPVLPAPISSPATPPPGPPVPVGSG